MSDLKDSEKKTVNEVIASYAATSDAVVYESYCEVIYDADKKEAKNKKTKWSKRVVVVSKYRLFLFKKNMILKGMSLEADFLLLDLTEIGQTGEKDVATFRFGTNNGGELVTIRDSHCGLLVKSVRQSIRQFTVGRPEEYSYKMLNDRHDEMDNNFKPGIAAGLIDAYLAHSNARKTIPKSDFIQYIQDLDEEKNHDLDLSACPGIEMKSEISFDLLTVGYALQHNTYFNSFIIKGVQHKDALNCLSAILKYNRTITKVIISGTQAEAPTDLGEALTQNKSQQLQILDLSHNTIPSAALVPIAVAFRGFKHRLRVLNLYDCGLTARGISALLHTFRSNWGFSLGIEELNLGKNKFDQDSTAIFCEWLTLMKSHSMLRRLCLADTGADGPALVLALKYSLNLEYLDLTGVKLSSVPPEHLTDLGTALKKLRVLRLSNCGMSVDSAVQITASTTGNPEIPSLALDLSSNDLGTKGGVALAAVLKRATNLTNLNLASNSLRSKGGLPLIEQLPLCVATLNLDNNFSSSSDSAKVTQRLGASLSMRPALTSLSLCGDKLKLKDQLVHLFEELKNNDTLKVLKVDGNSMEDGAMAVLANALRTNKTLTSLSCDNNKITVSGFQALKRAMDFNKTLVHWEYPVADYARNPTPKMHSILEAINAKIIRNGSYTPPNDVFEFALEWATPSRPPPGLCEVPQHLKDCGPPPDDEAISKLLAKQESSEAPDLSVSVRSPREERKSIEIPLTPPDELPPPPPPVRSAPPERDVGSAVPPPPAKPSRIPPPPSHTPDPPPPPPAAAAPPPPPAAVPPPPPPPASAPAPPPPPPSSSKGHDTSELPEPSADRSALLASIQSFKASKLKKVQTNDRSAPILTKEDKGGGGRGKMPPML